MTIKALMIAGVLATATALGAYANGGSKSIVKDRMDIMKSISNHMKTVGAMIKGDTAFDAEQVRLAAVAIAAHVGEIPEKFPQGSFHDPSEALPSV